MHILLINGYTPAIYGGNQLKPWLKSVEKQLAATRRLLTEVINYDVDEEYTKFRRVIWFSSIFHSTGMRYRGD